MAATLRLTLTLRMACFTAPTSYFPKAGVPAIFAKGYTHQVELGKEKTLELINSYWQKIYHKSSDEYNPQRDRLDGLVDDAQLFYEVGAQLTNSDTYPQWHKTSEFYRKIAEV